MRCFFYILFAALFSACASPKAPEGGPRDQTPPKILIDKSSPNFQTNFTKQDIVITFDEFVELQDLVKQVVISPPFRKNPNIEVRGKKMSISFHEDEPLKEDVTYVINFGDAIQDFTERNILKNYRYVFSTGSYIDSLVLKGKIIDAKEGEAVENALIMLYTENRDSVVFKNRPLYFASSDKTGNFSIENIRADTFKVFALLDANLNYLYDLESEAIAYLDSTIVVTDSIQAFIDLEMFSSKPSFTMTEYDAKEYGQVKMKFTEVPEKLQISYSIDSSYFQSELVKDSMYVWYNFPQDSAFSIFLKDNQNYFDTIRVRKLKKGDMITEKSVYLKTDNLDNNQGLFPEDSLKLMANHPISDIDTSKIVLTDSTTKNVEYKIEFDKENLRRIYLVANFERDSTYSLHLNPEAITDIFGLKNDSLSFSFHENTIDKYATLKLKILNMDSLIAYQVNILENGEALKMIHLNASNDSIPAYILEAKEYRLEIIEDVNDNSKWDSGNYLKKQKPERYFSKKLDKLKENWELVEELDLADIFKQRKRAENGASNK